MARHIPGELQARLRPAGMSDKAFFAALNLQCNTADEALRYLTTGNDAIFFFVPERADDLLQMLRSAAPDAEQEIVKAADRACAHIFDLLGSGATALGDRIDWHVDFKTNHRFDPHQYFASIRPAPYPGGYDIKVPWELSRCHHFVWLGQAYWFTKDEKYAREFVAQVESWLGDNPCPWGVNWTCTMDVAIRIANWLWGYHFFRRSPSLSADFHLLFHKALLIHGQHISLHLENEGDFSGNHYLSDLIGLAYIGILCPVFRSARQWREFGLREIEAAMEQQVYPDGANFEASTCYHRLVLEMFLSITILAERNGYQFGLSYMKRLEKMVEFVLYITKPDGTAPHIGDNDNGRLHRLKVWPQPEREWRDFRYLLGIGAVIFRRQDFAEAAGNEWEEAVWLCGRSTLDQHRVEDIHLPKSSQPSSKAFTDAGLYVMRQDDAYLIANAGSNGQNGNGGHAHNHGLSFELYAHGVNWIVDPGTYAYTNDYVARNLFRSTAYHSTVVVNDQEQTPLGQSAGSLFQLPLKKPPIVHVWTTNQDYDLFVGEQFGYERFLPSITHKRIIYFDRVETVWIIHDVLKQRGDSACITWLNLSPAVNIKHIDQLSLGVYKGNFEDVALIIVALQGYNPDSVHHDGCFSSGYGSRTFSQRIAWSIAQGKEDGTLAFVPGPRMAARRAAIAYQRYLQVQHAAT